jgi:hypothetical protein
MKVGAPCRAGVIEGGSDYVCEDARPQLGLKARNVTDWAEGPGSVHK